MEHELPTSVYLVIGILTVGNIGVIISVLSFIFKAGGFVMETRMGIRKVEDMAIRAHKRIDHLDGSVS